MRLIEKGLGNGAFNEFAEFSDPMEGFSGISRYRGSLVLDEDERVIHVMGVRYDVPEGFTRPGSVFRFHKTDELKEFSVDWGWLLGNLGKSVDVIMVASDNTSGPRATNIAIVVGEGEDSEARSFEVSFEV